VEVEPEVVHKLEGTMIENGPVPRKAKAEKALNALLKQYQLNLFSACAHSSVAALRADPELTDGQDGLIPMNELVTTNQV
jgi:hypothetical protein